MGLETQQHIATALQKKVGINTSKRTSKALKQVLNPSLITTKKVEKLDIRGLALVPECLAPSPPSCILGRVIFEKRPGGG